jgi:hypothetical protein
VLAWICHLVTPLLELGTLRKPVRAVDLIRFLGDEELAVDSVQAPSVLAHQFGLNALGHMDFVHGSDGAPSVRPVMVIRIRGPDADILKGRPLLE